MAHVENVSYFTRPAAADLSAKQYFFMQIDSSGNVNVSGDGGVADGVLANKPSASGRAATLAMNGIMKVELGGTVTAGDDVASDSAGKAVVATTGDVKLGTCVVGGASGSVGSIRLALENREALA